MKRFFFIIWHCWTQQKANSKDLLPRKSQKSLCRRQLKFMAKHTFFKLINFSRVNIVQKTVKCSRNTRKEWNQSSRTCDYARYLTKSIKRKRRFSFKNRTASILMEIVCVTSMTLVNQFSIWVILKSRQQTNQLKARLEWQCTNK